MTNLFNCDDINNIYIQKLRFKEIELLINSSKILYNGFTKWWLYSSSLNTMYKNYMENKFNDVTIYKLRVLFSNVKSKFRYYNVDGSIYSIFKSNNIYDLNMSNYLFGVDKTGRNYICFRKKTTDGKYNYICLEDTNNINNKTYYSSDILDNIDINRNHTFKCGCGNIFICSKQNFINTINFINT
tara:strand:+ start:188 stop:742 length:555 start_codon:yes stop_codon:yes gene_type:complete